MRRCKQCEGFIAHYPCPKCGYKGYVVDAFADFVETLDMTGVDVVRPEDDERVQLYLLQARRIYAMRCEALDAVQADFQQHGNIMRYTVQWADCLLKYDAQRTRLVQAIASEAPDIFDYCVGQIQIIFDPNRWEAE